MGSRLESKTAESLAEKRARISRRLAGYRALHRPETRAHSDTVAAALRFINHHLFEPELNVNRVKAECGIPGKDLSARFRAETGSTIRKYIEELRLRAARHLLRERELEIYLIALAVGYQHLETFYRAFRRFFGRTPLEDRLQELTELERRENPRPQTAYDRRRS